MRFALSISTASVWAIFWICGWTMVAIAAPPDASWEMASTHTRDGTETSLYVEAEKRPGRPAFRVETSLSVSPYVAATTLMGEMSNPGGESTGQTRQLIERSEREALVHTYVDLPFMFSDREIAIRIRHTEDSVTGIHRIAWTDENEVLPPVEDGVLRLASEGYWEFRPAGPSRTSATYVSRAEVGGSLPSSLSNRLMKKQTLDSVKRLHRVLAERARTHVASPPSAPEVGGE
jgi:hypothetical protein